MVDGTGQVFTTEPCKASLDPKWNVHYDLFLGRNDGITISVWNERKVHKKHGGGFLGCVRILASTIQRLKDTGCKQKKRLWLRRILRSNKFTVLDQRLELCKSSPDDPDPVKGQLIISLTSKDGPSGGNPVAIVGPGGDVHGPAELETAVTDGLPDGWEERKTNMGRSYITSTNSCSHTSQWSLKSRRHSASWNVEIVDID